MENRTIIRTRHSTANIVVTLLTLLTYLLIQSDGPEPNVPIRDVSPRDVTEIKLTLATDKLHESVYH